MKQYLFLIAMVVSAAAVAQGGVDNGGSGRQPKPIEKADVLVPGIDTTTHTFLAKVEVRNGVPYLTPGQSIESKAVLVDVQKQR